MFYHVKFGSSATKGVRINREEPQKLGALGPRPLEHGVVAEPLKTSPSPYVLPRQFW